MSEGKQSSHNTFAGEIRKILIGKRVVGVEHLEDGGIEIMLEGPQDCARIQIDNFTINKE